MTKNPIMHSSCQTCNPTQISSMQKITKNKKYFFQFILVVSGYVGYISLFGKKYYSLYNVSKDGKTVRFVSYFA